MRKILLFVLLLSILVDLGNPTLVGYDCSSHIANITSISAFSVDPCIIPPPKDEQKVETVQVLQERTYTKVHIKACLIAKSSIIFHCGMHHHTSIGKLVVNEIQHPNRGQCLALHDHGTYKINEGTVLTGHKVNSTQQTTVSELGYTTGDFRCKGTAFVYHGISYNDAVMESSYTITLSEEWASVDKDTGMLKCSSGYSHDYKRGTSFDISIGEMFWNSESPDSCSPTSFIVLYEGPAYFYKTHLKQETMVVNNSRHAMAIGIVKQALVCHQHGYQTEHPKIFVVLQPLAHTQFFFQKSSLDPVDIDMFLYVNSKLVYLEQHVGKELISVYYHFHQRACEIKKQLLQHMIAIAVISPEEFAWLYYQRPGVTAMMRGEIIYVMECEMVPVQLRKPEKCYHELPVTVNNTAVFLKPRSRIIVQYGTEVDCSPLVPSGYIFEGQWWSLQPKASRLASPVVMSAESEGTRWSYTSPKELFQAGIYSLEELMAFQKRLLFSVEKPAISHTLSAAAAHQNADMTGLDGSAFFHPGQLEKIQSNFLSKIWGWYWNVSVLLGGAVGIYLVFHFIRSLLSTIITCTCLYRAYGCSIELLSCFCGTCAKYLIMKRETTDDWPSSWERLRRWYMQRNVTRPGSNTEADAGRDEQIALSERTMEEGLCSSDPIVRQPITRGPGGYPHQVSDTRDTPRP